jgi:hypothetical protein
MPECPLKIDALPPNLRKNVDPASPVPLRGMGAKGLLPANPTDVARALFFLSYDPDENVAKTAKATMAGLPEKILGVALRDEDLQPVVLDAFAELLTGKDQYLEMMILNPSTSDETFARIAEKASEAIAETMSQNQLRFLRHEQIVRALHRNPSVKPVTMDLVVDFCLRSGLDLPDLAIFKEGRRRLYGESPEAQAEAEIAAGQETAEQALEELGADAIEEKEGELDEQKKLTINQRFARMSVSQKIKFVTLGNKEVRTFGLRDPNKLVAIAAITSPRITPGEVLLQAGSRTAQADVLRYIYSSRHWTKEYSIKVALMNNGKAPAGVTLKWLPLLRDTELKNLAKNKNISQTLANQARILIQKKSAPKQDGGGH